MLIEDWKLQFQAYENIACKAPCSVYSVLLENQLTNDPFYGCNEQKATLLSEEGCVFSSVFSVTEEQLQEDYIELTFYGLDTLAEVYCNDEFILRADNMHRTYTVSVKEYLKEGENTLSIQFSSPLEYVRAKNLKHYLYTNGDTVPGASHIRKASYMFGWDWGPVLPDMGIFRPVALSAYSVDKIENILIRQFHKDGKVTLDFEMECLKNAEGLRAEVTVDGQTVALKKNHGKVVIENPKLWWPNGFGEQYLYDVAVRLYQGDRLLDTLIKTIGLRTLTVSTQEDKYGNEFCFVVNGIKFFAMGADYVPEDNILSRISTEKMDRLLRDCKKANFNCLRVWGGGYYPDDRFYDLCDQYGIILWQDFMFACINVRMSKHFTESVTAEAIDNIKRLRHHPCLGLLCGNNEMETMMSYDEIGKSELVHRDYLELYENLLPDLVEEYAPQTFYLPSSPTSGGGFDDPDSENKGDAHFWKVWHGNAPFTEYRKHFFRFCSEFGFESFPSMKTIKSFTEEKDRNIFSKVMENHQKCKSGNRKILNYCAEEYLYCTSLEKLTYASQLNQGNAIRYGVEHFRRFRGRCMGATYWQLNDCWPVASWASIDYFGRWKALHYMAKRFFAPVLLSLHEDGYRVAVNLSNETMQCFEGKIVFSVKDSEFNTYSEQSIPCSVRPLSSLDAYTADVTEEMQDREEERFVTCTLYDKNGAFVSTQTLLFTKPKFFRYPQPKLTVRAEQKENGVDLQISSSCFVQNLALDLKNADVVFSDNYFDLNSDKVRHIFAETDLTAEQVKAQLTTMSVYDIG